MSTTNTSATNNGRAPREWSWSWTHLRIDRRSRGYCRVTFDHPPINTITATTVVELSELVSLIEQDPDLNVVVFDSVNPDFYLAHYDTEHDPGRTASLPVGPTGMHAWLDLLVRLSRAPVVSIAAIRGRARGAGSEFVLACDMRFASRENTLLGQFEVATGLVPGGGPMARLSRLVGRGRALEILLLADDLDGPRAEQYGYVNRLIDDEQLDDEVAAIGSRLARFDHNTIARTKSYVDQVTLPDNSELPPALADFFELSGRPAQQAQFARLEALGLNTDSDLERSLGQRVVDALPDVELKPRSMNPTETSVGAAAAAEFPLPRDGILLAHFIVSDDVERSRRFYTEVLGGVTVRTGEPAYVALSNSWIIINAGGGPTDDKPTVTLETPRDPDRLSSFLNIRVADIDAVYSEWSARGAHFLTAPIQRETELRCYVRDPDGYLIEVGQTTQPPRSPGPTDTAVRWTPEP